MKRRRAVILVATLITMLVLIFDGGTASEGIRQGINICLQTLIPALFPFFILSGIITSSILGQTIPCLTPIRRLTHMPAGSETLFAAGILGGYPIGAGMVWTAYHNGKLTQEEANRLVIFCNNAGPSFLFGVLGQLFPDPYYIWFLWGIQILSALLTGFLLGGDQKETTMDAAPPANPVDILNRSIRSMATVCGWVILFRMLLEFLDRWFLWILKPEVRVLVSGLLELSNGCLRLQDVSDIATRFLLASVMLSSGGLCILMQTFGVFPSLQIKHYLSGKLIHLVFSVFLSLTVLSVFSGQILLFGFCLSIIIFGVVISAWRFRKRKITVAIP